MLGELSYLCALQILGVKMIKMSITFALTSALLLSQATAQTPVPAGDACALLTPAEVSQTLGTTVAAAQHAGSSSITCIYSSSGKVGPGERQVIITLTPPSYFDAGNRSYGSMTAKPAADLGNGAYFLQNRIGTNVHVRKGDRAFELRVNPGHGGTESQTQIEQMEKSLAQKAMARL